MIDKPFSIGLTGGIGSGKSLVADMFAALGATLIDTDQIAHLLTAPGGLAMPAIASQFGPDFIDANGAMDRARMRAAVFSDPAVKRRLEAILHPLIRVETERAAAEAQGAYRIFVVPLLVESGKWKERVSRVLVVDCPEELQLARVIARNGLAEAQVRAIMAAQASRQARLDAADDVIVNDAGFAELTPQVERLHALYSELAQGIPQAN
nr:dephospho-CoA kinase [uncultured Noviherbaspirillum sp.]